jgi:hypothetical protein
MAAGTPAGGSATSSAGSRTMKRVRRRIKRAPQTERLPAMHGMVNAVVEAGDDERRSA